MIPCIIFLIEFFDQKNIQLNSFLCLFSLKLKSSFFLMRLKENAKRFYYK
jgi:hypothetical protein